MEVRPTSSVHASRLLTLLTDDPQVLEEDIAEPETHRNDGVDDVRSDATKDSSDSSDSENEPGSSAASRTHKGKAPAGPRRTNHSAPSGAKSRPAARSTSKSAPRDELVSTLSLSMFEQRVKRYAGRRQRLVR